MKTKIKNLIKILFFATYSMGVMGAQKFTVSDGDVIKVKISSRDLTRITVDGGRIEKLWGPTGVLETQADKKDGEVYIRPGLSAGNALSFFVKDEFGSTYTLIGEQYDLPSQTIILSPLKRVARLDKEKMKNDSLIREIKNLIKAIYLDNSEGNYEVVNVNKEVPLWKETKTIHLKDYLGDKIKGEEFELKNTTSEIMKLSEEEFLNFRSSILAVAIEKLSIEKGEATRVFIIRNR